MKNIEKSFKSNIEKYELDKVQRLAKEYEKDGYSVEKLQTLKWLDNFEADLVISKEGKHTIVEVKSQGSMKELKGLDSIIEKVNERKNWSFELVISNPKTKTSEQNFKDIEKEHIDEFLENANELIEFGQYAQAVIMLWPIIEVIFRRLLREEKIKVKGSPLIMIRDSFSLGLINKNAKMEELLVSQYNSHRHCLHQGLTYASF